MLDAQEYNTIGIEIDGSIATLTLDGPDPRNAVTDVMHSELSTIFAAIDDDPRVRVAVLTGAGTVFSTGGDTSPDRAYASTDGPDRHRRGAPHRRRHHRHVHAAHRCGQRPRDRPRRNTRNPCGHLLHGCVCQDRRPTCLGRAPAGNGSAAIWPLLIGVNRAKYLLMTGEIIGADDAERFGLITRRVADGEALTSALDMATRLVGLAPQAVEGTKRSVNRLLALASDASLPFSLALEEAAMAHPDFRAAFVVSNGEVRDERFRVGSLERH